MMFNFIVLKLHQFFERQGSSYVFRHLIDGKRSLWFKICSWIEFKIRPTCQLSKEKKQKKKKQYEDYDYKPYIVPPYDVRSNYYGSKKKTR